MRRRVLFILGAVLVAGGSAYAAVARATTLPRAESAIWERSESPHFEIFVPRGFGVPVAFADSLERALADVRAQFPATGRGPRVVVALTRGHAAKLNGGRPIAGMYVPDTHSIVLVRSVINPTLLRHELAHSEVARLWGPRHDSTAWLDEGIATVVGTGCETLPPSSIARMHLETGRLPRLAQVLEDFHSIPEIQGYPAAASIVELLLTRGDTAVLERIWRGAPIEVGEQEWRDFVQRAPKFFSTPGTKCSARGA